MNSANRKFAIVGLGRIGGNLARQALEKGFSVVGLNQEKFEADLIELGLSPLQQIADLKEVLTPPRTVFIFVPAGAVVDQLIDELLTTLDKNDIIVDGGNSYWGESIRRYEMLKSKGLHFIDMGTSGGWQGARHGACFMVGGDVSVVAQVEPILRKLSTPGGYVHAGPPGAGHFAKLVHNGIEFGMMQAIGEGLDLLENYNEGMNIAAVLEAWRHGSVIRSWLIDLLTQGYMENQQLRNIPGYVEDTGEVNWLVEDAAHMSVPIPVIAQSVWQLMNSRDEVKTWAKAIAAMRHGFGAHPFGPNELIGKGRGFSRGPRKF